MLAVLDILTPVVQYLFAGFCAILLGFLFWIVKSLLKDRSNHFATIGDKMDNVSDRLKSMGGRVALVRERNDWLEDKLANLPCADNTATLNAVTKSIEDLQEEVSEISTKLEDLPARIHNGG